MARGGTDQPPGMGALVLPRYLRVLGWLGTAAMAAAEIAFLVG